MIPGLTEGRIVHYVLPSGKHRPAIVVQDWKEPSGSVNLQVFLDGTADRNEGGNPADHDCTLGIVWRTSVTYNESAQPGTWHWPEKNELGHVAGEGQAIREGSGAAG